MDAISALLVVRDNTLQAHLCTTLEKTHELDIQWVQDTRQAWKCLSAKSYEILFVEHLPNGTGSVQLVEKTATEFPATYVMMGATQCTAKEAVSAMQAGADDFLIDPLDAQLVDAAFEKAVCSIKRRGRDLMREAAVDTSIVTADPDFMGMLEIARKVAPSSATVMITGESGTGKELLAKFIHANSGRASEPYVAINCAALPEQLAESELFGHDKGAFTGAITRKIGKFESAGKGTLVLDEITEMPLPLQAKLLRALQEKEIVPLGSNRPVPVAARVIAISNRNMKQVVKSGAFREDLYYRLGVIPLTIPPLRNRKNDVPLLVQHFFQRFSVQNSTTMTTISESAMERLTSQEWPGNVRELENTIERGVLIGSGSQLLPEHLILEEWFDPSARKPALGAGMTVREMEKELIYNTLDAVNDNRTHAAKMLGISIRTLRNKLNEYREETGQAAVSG